MIDSYTWIHLLLLDSLLFQELHFFLLFLGYPVQNGQDSVNNHNEKSNKSRLEI